MTIAALALVFAASLLAPARAAQMPAVEALLQTAGQQQGGLDFSRFKPEPAVINPATQRMVPAAAMGAPMTVVPLPQILDAMRKTTAVFYAGGVPVHVFGAKSQNDRSRKSWFLELYPEGAKDNIFLNGWNILRWTVFLRGMGHAEINGIHYDVHIDGSLSNEMASKLVIDPKQKGSQKTVLTIEQISRASFETGYPVRIGGTEYRVIYASDFTSQNGQFVGYSGDRSIVLMFVDGPNFGAYHFYEKDLKSDDVLVTSPPKSTLSENQQMGQVTLGLRVNESGNLEIYYPVPARAAPAPAPLRP